MLVLPDAFQKRMQGQLGEDWGAFQAALDSPSPVSINYNQAKSPAILFEGDPVPWNSSGQYLPVRPSFTLDPHFHAGRYYVQEAGSMFLAFVLNQLQQNHSFRTALDLCGAPGGKTTVMLNELPEGCTVVANEIIKTRYGILKDNLAKWGRSNIIATNADSERFVPLAGKFDLVVVDAPCSGEGLFRKTPEATSEWSPENVAICENRQNRIVDNTLPLVSPGGFLIYSTCTYNEGENDQQVARIIEDGKFEKVSFDLPEAWGITPTRLGYQFFPNKTKSEGFYIAVLQKAGSPIERKSKVPLRYFTPAPKQLKQSVSPWISPEAPLELVCAPSGQVYGFPEHSLSLLGALSQSIPKIDPGTPIGIMKGKQLVPNHALSLSLALHPDIPVMDLGHSEALSFLRKTPLPGKPGHKGWHLMRYEGWGIGWGKILPNRINNYFPNHLRVRMSAP
ncbi:MAG: RNA methyltransferase [Phaeodactylibacter sp.]|nr:RNA methyltransferase [Phaeodactylibacter sp.]